MSGAIGVSVWNMENENTTIGLRDGWGGHVPFGISRADRSRHVYAVGQTGVGKSTLIFNMAVQDIHAGHGIAFIDPHGDIAQALQGAYNFRCRDIPPREEGERGEVQRRSRNAEESR